MEVHHLRKQENNRITVSIVIPFLFIALLWLVYFAEIAFNTDWSAWGINPREPSGLIGIIFTPFLHGSLSHLLSNSIPLLLLGAAMIYFYRDVAYKVFVWIWLIDGLGVWLLGRSAYHIGASGLVYGMASFLFFSGIMRKNRQLSALSLAIVFLYGGLIWGMFPYVPDISWEAHLFGFLAGIYFSIHYLKTGPPNDPVPEWMNEEVEEPVDKNENESDPDNKQSDIHITYHYLPNKDDDKKE